jgi:hypothetical protein
MRKRDSFWQMALPDENPGGDREAWVTTERELTKGTQLGARIDKERTCRVPIPAEFNNAVD